MSTKNTLILSTYPLSRDYLEALSRKIGSDVQHLSLAELRQQGGLKLLLTLRTICPERLLLPLEDKNSAALLPIMKLVASLTRAGRIEVVDPELSFQTISRWNVVAGMFQFGLATLDSVVVAMLAWWGLRALLRVPRCVPGPVVKGRVLYLKTNLWFGIKAGGSVGHIAGVVNALHNAGYPVTFASAEPPVMVDPKVTICKVAPPATFGLPYELNNYRFQRDFEARIRPLLALTEHKLIYQRLSIANYTGVTLSRRFCLPLVVEYNGSEAWISRHWGRPLRFHRLAVMAEDAMLRHAHLVVTISEVLRDELIAKGVAPERIVTYPNCIDPEVFSPDRFSAEELIAVRQRYGIAPQAKVVAFLGTFGQWHGAEVLAQAIARLAQEQPGWLAASKAHFMLVGDGVKMREVRQVIDQAGAAAVCTLTGLVPQDQAPLHLATADILVSPHVPNADGSRFFGSPTKLFEYMAMGKGIYASRLDQIADVLSPGLDCAYLPGATVSSEENAALAVLGTPGDVNALMAGIKFLVDRPDWCARLGRNARQCALDRYTWHHHGAAILEGVRRLPDLGGRTSP